MLGVLGFRQRLIQGVCLRDKRSDSTICETTSRYVYCCPDNADCVNDNGVWRCNDNPFGLTRGQKIGIGIGVTVAFFVVCIAGLVIFCCCCRKAAKIASAAVSNQQNPQAYQSQPQPVMYGGPPMHDQHAIPMTATGPHVAGEGKSYADQGYPPQQRK
ncbi:hypothetical protein BDZ91DRAFT_545316 [Kalaharituber pfeilii]|nr:hypothetical protein BDZ91DRAFT_545316 [Kalaharituber pfeilii]